MWQASVVPNAGSARTSSSSSSRDSCDFHAKFTYAGGVSTTLSLPWSLFEHTVGNGMTMVPKSHPGLIDLTAWLRETTAPEEIKHPIPELPMISAAKLEHWLHAGRTAVALIEKFVSDGSAGSLLPAYPLDAV